MSLILFSSSPDATACRSANLLFTPWFYWYIPCTSFYTRSFSFFHSLCLGDSVVVCIHPRLTSQGSPDNCSDSFSTFVIRRIFSAQSLEFFELTILGSFPVFLFEIQLSFSISTHGHWLPRSATQAVPVRSTHASFSGCLVQRLPCTTPFFVIHKTAPVRS